MFTVTFLYVRSAGNMTAKGSKNTNSSKDSKLTKLISDEPFDIQRAYDILNTGKDEDGQRVLLIESFSLFRKAIVYLLGLEIERNKQMQWTWDSDANAMEDMERQRQQLKKEGKEIS